MARITILLSGFVVYAILFILAVPKLSQWLGTSPVGEVTVVLLIAPLIVLYYYLARAVKHRAEGGRENSAVTNRTELLWRGRLPLMISFWFGYIPSTVFAFFVGRFAWSRIKRPGAGEVDAAIGALILIVALLFLAVFGTWRSGDQYKGSPMWIFLSRAGMIVGTAGCMLAVLLSGDLF